MGSVVHGFAVCLCVCVVCQTEGFTPLYAASHNGHVEVVRALVGAGAAVNQADVRDDRGVCWCSVVLALQLARVALHACVRRVQIKFVCLCVHVYALFVTVCLRACVFVRLVCTGIWSWIRSVTVWAWLVYGWVIVLCQRNGSTPLRIARRFGHAGVAGVLAAAGGR